MSKKKKSNKYTKNHIEVFTEEGFSPDNCIFII